MTSQGTAPATRVSGSVTFDVTAAAERFARRMVRLSALPPGAGLQLRVAPGGCSGFTTTFDVAAAPSPAEQVVAVDASLRLFVDAPSARLLEGATLDFVENATDAGLKVLSPQAGACCSSSAAPPGVASVPVASIGRMHRG